MPRGRKPNYKGRSRQFHSGEDIERQMKDDSWRRKKEEPEAEAEDSEEESDEEVAKKGTGLIEVENPNRVQNKLKKADDITVGDSAEKPELSRREREAIEKEQARQRYEKLHAEGKTDEARADLARLAIVRKQREEAAKKKQLEKEEKDAKLVEAESARKSAMEAQLSEASGTGRKKKKGR